MYNVTLWRVRVTTVAVEKQQRILCVVELNGTIKYLEILSAVNSVVVTPPPPKKSKPVF
jgi:hypothetical protein